MEKLNIPMFRVHISEESIRRVNEVLRSGYIGDGPVVKEFEKKSAETVGAPYVVAVNSGTSALHLAVILAGVGPGDEVITTAQTMMATSHAILMQRAVPVFADIQYLTGNIDPADIEKRITRKTKAILAVHWAGYPCDMDEITAIADAHNLIVIEDAAHALGAEYKGKPIGGISPLTCFSLQAIKHVTAGDGGLIALKDEAMWRRAFQLRWFGIDRDLRKPSLLGEPEWDVTELGYKYHMNDLAAAVALGNLADLPAMIQRRREIAALYRQAFSGLHGITLFDSARDRASANWIFSMHVEKRDAFLRAMKDAGIMASVVHLRIDRNSVYGGLRKDLPQLERFTETQVALPISEMLSDEDVEYIVDSVKDGME